ncbi:hypothetical protein B0H14DRAFT_2986813 [Mycena olivaceomarginata]|nr:hypothetical protein B0H14DRAFT_2986813 [Mycena olivaceomarginata]
MHYLCFRAFGGNAHACPLRPPPTSFLLLPWLCRPSPAHSPTDSVVKCEGAAACPKAQTSDRARPLSSAASSAPSLQPPCVRTAARSSELICWTAGVARTAGRPHPVRMDIRASAPLGARAAPRVFRCRARLHVVESGKKDATGRERWLESRGEAEQVRARGAR